MRMNMVNIYDVNRQQIINNNVITSNIPLSRITQSNSTILPQSNKINPLPVQEPGRSRWGPAVWLLFHTMAYKIKESDFLRLKNEILDIITNICSNLPCPACATHATEYMKRLNYNSINNKDDFKVFFYNFHNDVNRRKGVMMFPLNELDTKYSNANTINVIRNFVVVFQYRNGSFNMIANDMQRNRQSETIKIWFNNNIKSFEL
jgi:hypothetical protein